MRTSMLLLIGLCVTRLHAQTGPETLVRLRGVAVAVDSLGPVPEHPGLETSDIQTDVELKLRQAGISVLSSTKSWWDTPGHPLLWVRLTLGRVPGGLFIDNIGVQLYQTIKLARDSSVVADAVTWQVWTTGAVGGNNLRSLREVIGDQVNRFINVYLAANPRH